MENIVADNTKAMKLQELINKLCNMLASGAAEAEVMIDNKYVESIGLTEINGVKTVVIAPIK
jgi:hypothetical protein